MEREAAHCCDAWAQGFHHTAITMAGIELMNRIARVSLGDRPFWAFKARTASAVWNAILEA